MKLPRIFPLGRTALGACARFGAMVGLCCILSGNPAFAKAPASADIEQNVKALIQLQSKGVVFSWTGNQDYAGEMLKLTVKNQGDKPVQVNLRPGMVLDPANGRSQRLIIETSGNWSLAPGQIISDVPVRCYCLDSSLDAPASGENMSMAFVSELPLYEKEIEVLLSALELSKKGQFSNTSEPLTHFTVVVQRALWMVYSPRNVLTVDLDKLMEMEAVPTKPDPPLVTKEELLKEFTEEMSGYNSGALNRVGLSGFGAEQFARPRGNVQGNSGGPSADISEELFEKVWKDINLILVAVSGPH